MQVQVFPVVYSGDLSKLPTIKSDDSTDLMLIQFDDDYTDELIDCFLLATRRGCQWLEFRDQIVRDEVIWRNI